MRITKRNLRRILERFEDAVREDEVKGYGVPTDIPEIEQELKDARRALREFLNEAIEE